MTKSDVCIAIIFGWWMLGGIAMTIVLKVIKWSDTLIARWINRNP